MPLKIVAVFGWIFFTLNALAVLWMFATKNVGDDAAGRGMATGFAILLTPMVLAMGGLLLWAQRNESMTGVASASFVLGIPFGLFALSLLKNELANRQYARYKSGFGDFEDSKLRAVVAAIRTHDLEKVNSLAQAAGIDWEARDTRGQSILGFAVADVLDSGGDEGIDVVEILLKAGAKYQDDCMQENGHMFASVVGYGGDHFLKLIDALLTAGANPNAPGLFDDDRPLLIHHNMTAAKAQVLIAHGADLTSIRDSRSDRPGWDALMNAVYMQEWPLALFYLEQGCDPTYMAQDGKTARDVLQDLISTKQMRTWASQDTLQAFVKALENNEQKKLKVP